MQFSRSTAIEIDFALLIKEEKLPSTMPTWYKMQSVSSRQ